MHLIGRRFRLGYLVVAIAAAWTLTPCSFAQDVTPEVYVEHMFQFWISDLHTQRDGKLSEDEAAKVAAAKDAATKQIKAHPQELHANGHDDSIQDLFRGALTDAHQKMFDKQRDEEKRTERRASNLLLVSQLETKWWKYTSVNRHPVPKKLGDMADVLRPQDLLLAQSKVTIPTNWGTMSKEQRSTWINKNTELLYLPCDPEAEDANRSTKVLFYVKPDAAGEDGNTFITVDGLTHTLSADQSKKVVEELEAGKNPPPSLDIDHRPAAGR